jgi:drug/metabolite transporter (DMT)-like permease
MNQSDHRKGLFIVMLAPLAWSSSGLFARAISADLMAMLFWRGLFSGTAVFLAFLLIERRAAFKALAKLRWPSVAVAVLSAGGMITGIGSLRYASIADSMVIYATVPFITAGVAYLAIGERPSRSTILASGVALAGVLIMLFGAGFGGSMFGKFLALVMTFCMAGFSVLLRRNRDVPMLPAMAASAYLAAFFCFWFADSLHVSSHDFWLIGLFGIVQNALGLIFYTLGSRLVPAAEATLIAALEVPLTPLWVWLFMGETPGPYTLIGGAVVLVALFAHILSELRRTPSTLEAEFVPAP